MSWTALCEALEQETANLNALEGSPRKRRKRTTTLEACFNFSLNALRNEDEEAWNAFVWLGVLPEDVQIAAPMATTLWESECPCRLAGTLQTTHAERSLAYVA